MPEQHNKHRSHYVHHLRYSTQERLVGLFILSAIAILFGLLFLSSQTLRLFDSRITLYAFIQNPVGVSADTDVRISGITVGSVKKISLNPDNLFKVELSIFEDFNGLIRSNSRASVSKLAFIGDSIINITPGDANRPLLASGSTITVDETLTIDQMITNLKPVLDKINNSVNKIATVIGNLPGDALNESLYNVADASKNLKQITQQVNRGQGTASALINDRQAYQALLNTIASLQDTLADAQLTMQNTRQATTDLPKLIADLQATIKTIRQESSQLPELSNSTRNLLDDAQKTVDAINSTWPISGNIPDDPNSERAKLLAPTASE